MKTSAATAAPAGGSLATIDMAGAAALVGVALVAYFLGFAPVQRAAAVARAQAAELETRQAELDSVEQQFSTAKESLHALQAQLNNSSNLLKRTSELYTRIQALTELAQGLSLGIDQIKPSPEVPGPRFNRVPIQLSGVGGYAGFSDFLRQMHAKYADLQVVSFKLSGRADDLKAKPRFDAELDWYTSADSAGKASASAGAGDDGHSIPDAPGSTSPAQPH